MLGHSEPALSNPKANEEEKEKDKEKDKDKEEKEEPNSVDKPY